MSAEMNNGDERANPEMIEVYDSSGNKYFAPKINFTIPRGLGFGARIALGAGLLFGLAGAGAGVYGIYESNKLRQDLARELPADLVERVSDFERQLEEISGTSSALGSDLQQLQREQVRDLAFQCAFLSSTLPEDQDMTLQDCLAFRENLVEAVFGEPQSTTTP